MIKHHYTLILFITSLLSAQPIIVTPNGVGIGTDTPRGQLDIAGQGGLIVSSANLAPANNYDLTPLQNSGTLLIGSDLSNGNGEINLIANRGTGNIGGFAFYDYSNSGALTPLLQINGDNTINTTGTVTVGALKVGSSPIFSEGYFESEEQTILGTATTMTVPHGLAGIPRFWTISLRCIVSEFGWSPGDEILLSSIHMGPNSDGCTTGVNAINFRMRQKGNIYINRLDTTTTGYVSASKWRLIFRAWR